MNLPEPLEGKLNDLQFLALFFLRRAASLLFVARYSKERFGLLVACVLTLSGAFAPCRVFAQPPTNKERAAQFQPAQTPAVHIRFERNVGQVQADAMFIAHNPSYDLFLTASEAVLKLRTESSGTTECRDAADGLHGFFPASSKSILCDDIQPNFLRLRLKGDRISHPDGRKPLASYSNYFIGNDPSKWRTHVPQFAEVWYANTYPGIDLVYYGENGQLEYDFVVAPHANANLISFSVSDNSGLRVDGNGDLAISVGDTEVFVHRPRLYQGNACPHTQEGFHKASAATCKSLSGGRFTLRKSGLETEIGFVLPPYDHAQALVIDPVVSFSTFLGGSVEDSANGMAVDSAGNIYLVGTTDSPDFPVTANAFEKGTGTAFVTKMSGDGSTLIYSTYLGGGGEMSHGIAVDSSGNAYVTGETYSTNFPVVNAFQSKSQGGSGYVSKLSPDGSSLIFSTYLGGTLEGSTNSIAVDASGEAVVAGRTYSLDFPVVNAFQPSHASDGGDGDATVTKFAADGESLVFSTYLGGNSNDAASGVALDPAGNIYVGGITYSSNFPVTPGAYQTTFNAADIESSFVSKFSPTGSLVYSTYLAASQTFGIAVNSAGNAFVTGSAATELPVTPGAFQTVQGGGASPDAFVTEFDTTGASLVYSTFLGGDNIDNGNAIAVDSNDNAYVTGQTNSVNFPLQLPVQAALVPGLPAVFVSEFNSTGSQLLFSTYLGGGEALGLGTQQGNAIAVDSAGNIYVSGLTQEPDFPVVNALQPTLGPDGTGIQNAFVTKFLNQAAPAIALSSATVSFAPVVFGSVSAPQTITLTNIGTASLNVSSVTISGNFSETNNCNSAIFPKASCAVQATFAPMTIGPNNGQISINSNATLFPEIVQLTGNGQNFSFGGTPANATISAGQSTNVALSLQPESGFAQQVTFSCAGTPTGSGCTFSPNTATLDGTHTAIVTMTITTTGAASARMVGGARMFYAATIALLGLLFCVPSSRTNKKWVRMCAALAITVLGTLSLGCGGSGGGGGNGSGGGSNATPSGTYNIIITAKSGSTLSNSLEFTLTVN